MVEKTSALLDFNAESAESGIYDYSKTRSFRNGDRRAEFKPNDIIGLTVDGKLVSIVTIKAVKVTVANKITHKMLEGSKIASLSELHKIMTNIYSDWCGSSIVTIITWTY